MKQKQISSPYTQIQVILSPFLEGILKTRTTFIPVPVISFHLRQKKVTHELIKKLLEIPISMYMNFEGHISIFT